MVDIMAKVHCEEKIHCIRVNINKVHYQMCDVNMIMSNERLRIR